MAFQITRGAQMRAQKVVIYGPEGIGKTTFASKFPEPLFIDTEDGSNYLDVARYPVPQSWTELKAMVQEVINTKPCKTLVLDTADWAERLAIEHILAENRWKSIGTQQFGAGYTALAEEYGKFLNLLSDVADAGMNVVVTAHAIMRHVDRPELETGYDRWELKLSKKCSSLTKEWADAVLFLNYKTIVETVQSGMSKVEKARGGRRYIYSTHNVAWDAKNRWGLDDELPLDFAEIATYFQAVAGINKPKSRAASASKVVETAQPTSKSPMTPVKPVERPKPVGIMKLPKAWEPMRALLEHDHIAIDEVRAYAIAKGHYTADTPLENYNPNYIGGFLIANWETIKSKILANREATSPIA